MLTTAVLLATLAYTGIGLVIFVLGFWLWDKATPADLWGEVCKGNQAVEKVAAPPKSTSPRPRFSVAVAEAVLIIFGYSMLQMK